MPEVDFMVVCDYVRVDGGVMHMIAGGIDTIYARQVPSAQNLGVALRLLLTRNECDRDHQMELIFQDEDGAAFARVEGQFQVSYPERVPPGWRAYALLSLNIGVPLPHYGVYSLELLVDGQAKKSVPLRVTPVAELTR